MNCSRRSALQVAGVAAGVAATADCLDTGTDADDSLAAAEMDDSLAAPFLVPDPVDLPAVTRVDYTTETRRAHLEAPFDTGHATGSSGRAWRRRWGTETRPRPVSFERDGVFFAVAVVRERRLERDRWTFGCERTNERPAHDDLARFRDSSRRTGTRGTGSASSSTPERPVGRGTHSRPLGGRRRG